MRTFDRNLDAYHALRTQGEVYVRHMCERLQRGENVEVLLRESSRHFEEQGKLYKELGEEMVKIMSVKWWQFWK